MKRRGQDSGFRVQENPWILAAFIALAAISAQAAELGARDAFDAGLQAFAASNYPTASNAFLEAAAAAPAEKLDPSAAHYNAALSAYAAGDLKAAADLFSRAATSPDLGLQAKAYYNRGNALFQQAGGPASTMPIPMPTMSTQELASAESSVGEAIQMYENAIALDPRDADAKANYELAVLKQQQLQQQKQQQQDQQKQDQQKQDPKDQDQPPQDPKQEEQQDQQQKQQDQQPQAEPQPQPEPEQPDQQQEEEPIQDEKPSEEMTPEEAAMMLDSMKAQEQSQRDRLHPFFGRPVPVEKDW